MKAIEDGQKRLGVAAFALLDMLVQSCVKAGQSLVVECAFWYDPGILWLSHMREQYDFRVLELHCHADQATVIRRYAVRESSPGRHGGHRALVSVDARVVELRDNYGRYGPLTVGEGLVRIDTSDFAAVDYGAITELVRTSLAHHALD